MRFYLVCAGLLLATTLSAQDNIVLRNGDEIPAKVLEISPKELKYRKSANLEGPVYTAPIRDVLFIKYANGTKDTFGPQKAAVAPDTIVSSTNQAETTVEKSTEMSRLSYHRRLLSRYYTDQNGQRLSVVDAKPLFMYEPKASSAYNRGRSLSTWSLVTGIPAIVLIGTGIGAGVADRIGGNFGDRQHFRGNDDQTGNTTATPNRDDRMHRGGIGIAVAGSGVILGVASLWLSHRSTVYFHRAAKHYNGRNATSLQVIPSSQGIGAGLALRF
jgi:hypothetical protein